MKPEELNPYVRFFKRALSIPNYNKMNIAYDFRLFYLKKGAMTFEFESGQRDLTAGDVITIRPGIAYKISRKTEMEVEYFILNFDFVFDAHYRPPRTPAPRDRFEPDRIFSTACCPPFDGIFIGKDSQIIEPVLEEMHENSITESPDKAILGSALLKCILAKLIWSDKTRNRPSQTNKLIRDIKEYIHEHIDTALTNRSVAEYFGYHPYYLNQVFSGAEETTLHHYISTVKVKTAKEKLSVTETPISVIAGEMGFANPSYFSAFFRKMTGMTPKEYRALCK